MSVFKDIIRLMSIESTHRSKTKFDAIVALGGGISPEGQLSTISNRRVEMAYYMYRQGLAGHIITSGRWYHRLSHQPANTESEAMRAEAIQLGVPSELVIAEARSQDTVGNAYYVKREVLEPNGWNKLAVVTGAAHTKRADTVFKKVLGGDYDVQVYPTLETPSPDAIQREGLGLQAISEQFAVMMPGDDQQLVKNFQYLSDLILSDSMRAV